MNKKRIASVAIFPGTFDPITNGHMEIIKRGLGLFDRIIIGIAAHSSKQCLFSIEERKALIDQALIQLGEAVEVCTFSGLLVNFMASKGVNIILRGLRSPSDYEYEVEMDKVNRTLASEIETVFLAAGERLAYIRSSRIKEIASLGGEVRQFVPEAVASALAKRVLTFEGN